MKYENMSKDELISELIKMEQKIKTWEEAEAQKEPGKGCKINHKNELSEHKWAKEAALQEHLLFLGRLLDTIPNPIFYKDLKGIHQGCNKAFEECIGLSKDQIIGKSVYDLYPKDLADKYCEMDGVLFREPGVQTYDFYFLFANGVRHNVTFSKASYLNLHGEVAGLVGVMAYITERKRAEEKLQMVNRQLQDIIEFHPDATFAIDINRKVISWNRAMEEMTGVRKEDIIGKGDYAYAVPFYGRPRPILVDFFFENNNNIKKYYKNFEKKGETVYGETYSVSLPGKNVYLWGKASPLYDRKGKMIGAVQSIRDITRQKKAEALLMESEKKYRTLVENANDIIYKLDNSGNFTYISKTVESLYHYKVEEIIGTHFTRFVHPDDRPILLAALDRIIAGKRGPYEFRVLDKDGRVRHIRTSSSPILENNKLLGISGFIVDITDRKRFEEVLKESMEQYRRLVELSPDAIIVQSEGHIVFVNKTGRRTYGAKNPEKLIGRRLTDFVHPKDRKMIEELFKRVLKEKTSTSFKECKFIIGNGSVIDTEIAATPFTHCGKPAVQAVIRNISERKKFEKEITRLDRLHLIGEMAASIGHEIRNPMTAVKGFLQLFKSRKQYEKDREHLDLMISELDRANSIITEFLSLARNKAVNRKPQNLNTIIETIHPLIAADALITDNYIDTELQAIPDLPLDEKEIRQMILNLVRNGLEAMLPGGRLKISTYPVNGSVTLAIQDQGRGIEPDILEKLGSPFFTTKENGTGLGLAVCYSIAARHNAKIEVDASPAGTTFYVKFQQPKGTGISIPDAL